MHHPGKDHLSHRLCNLGLGHREAVLGIFAIGFAAGGLACLLLRVSAFYANLTVGWSLSPGLLAILLLEKAPYEKQELMGDLLGVP